MKKTKTFFADILGCVTLFMYISQGYSDLCEGLVNWRIWHLIGSGELRRRYARSRLGQFWLTLSTAITIMIMAFVWSVLFKTPLDKMLPYLAVSIILWQFMANVMSDAGIVFISNKHILLSQRIPCSVIVYSAVYRNFLVLIHNLIIIPIIFIVFCVPVKLQIMLMIPALCLIIITASWVSYLVGIFCSRYRDLSNIISAIMQLAFYVTPVIWKPGFMEGQYQWLLLFNPFTYFLSILRSPIFGEPIHYFDWIVAFSITFGGLFLTIILIGKYRRRIMYWI